MSREHQEMLDLDLEEIIMIFGSIVSSSNKLTNLQELLREFKKSTGIKVPIKKFGYKDIRSFITEMCSENLELLESGVNPIVVLKDREIPIKSEDESTQNAQDEEEDEEEDEKEDEEEDEEEAQRKIREQMANASLARAIFNNTSMKPKPKKQSILQLQREELKSRIQEIISNNPDGLRPYELMELYWIRYKCQMNYTPFGFRNLLAAASAANNVAVVQESNGNWLILDKVNASEYPPENIYPRPETPPTTEEEEDALPGVLYDIERIYRDDFLNLTERVLGIDWSDIECDSLIPVVVTEIYSPSHFWINILDRNLKRQHSQMTKDLQHYFCDGEGRGQVLLTPACQVGQYCVVRMTKTHTYEWVRAVIVKRLDFDTVKVRLVDYGCIKRVPVPELLPLPRCFAAVRTQAIRVRLAGVRPSAGASRWSIPATNSFRDLTKRIDPLIANIVHIDREEQALEVLLVRPYSGNDLCLNTELKHTGYADPVPSSSEENKEKYLLPRFQVLENGETLGFSEICRTVSEGVDLNTIEEFRRHVSRQMQEPEPNFRSVSGLEMMQQVVRNLPEAAVRSFAVIAVAQPTAAQQYLTQLITPSPPNE